MAVSSVHNAALNKQFGLVRSLVSQDHKLVEAVDDDGRTPLHWAASSGSVDIVRYLIDEKADVNLGDSGGWTPLHIASSGGFDVVVRELLGAGAEVNRTNDKGITPLHYAASKSRVEIGKLLIARGADINARDRANQTPLHRAATTGSTGFISLLLKPPEGSPKTRLNPADRVGNTPLHLAMESAHAEAACLLILAGADRERENLDGEMPEDLEGVGGQEQRRAKAYVIERCGKR
ncbi:transporter [Ganoderma sinense ZZ0214-1]|uniref:Transporter n=1 Tax=Ganoderma sinense ZZ0214-1 TaxID=1077348 RepID=A0A2G8SPD3_9APHY|nr:transporter [Ganoderma sinense ZZ0214-1]